MIRLWISARSSASIREQLGAQVLLGILSGRLAPGERLPSIRALARHLRIHPNTISSVYRDLSARGWLQTRQGSGVFISDRQQTGDGLGAFVTEWLNAAERRGFTPDAVERELSRRLQQAPVLRHSLVVDPDAELARIIATEISSVLAEPVAWTGVNQVAGAIRSNSRVFVNAGHADQIAPILPAHPLELVRLKSMQDFLAGQARPERPVLIGVVSRSCTVLRWASTLLSALGWAAGDVVLRNPAVRRWQQGLRVCDILATDVCAARELPANLSPTIFQVVTSESLAALAKTM